MARVGERVTSRPASRARSDGRARFLFLPQLALGAVLDNSLRRCSEGMCPVRLGPQGVYRLAVHRSCAHGSWASWMPHKHVAYEKMSRSHVPVVLLRVVLNFCYRFAGNRLLLDARAGVVSRARLGPAGPIAHRRLKCCLVAEVAALGDFPFGR
ncbi:hypothetical protein BD413DRAFT_36881 [Trametes elegans]|nr:hypothetical protein BD413DRAFT_36881 [Trametes elegans]